MSDAPSAEWIEECLHWWGRVLDGRMAHWCPEWDYLPIDETCEIEMTACICDLEGRND